MIIKAGELLLSVLFVGWAVTVKPAKRATAIGVATQMLQKRREALKVRRIGHEADAEAARETERAWGMFQAMLSALPPE